MYRKFAKLRFFELGLLSHHSLAAPPAFVRSLLRAEAQLSLGCYSRKFVRQFLCVNFAHANSYVRNAIHKTLLPTKNRKFVRKYTQGVSCRTTENFSKDNELVVVQLHPTQRSHHTHLSTLPSSPWAGALDRFNRSQRCGPE